LVREFQTVQETLAGIISKTGEVDLHMNIGLISPYPTIYSFGIRVISACLKKEGHNVKTIFLAREFWNRYENRTLEKIVELFKDADLIGISVMTNFFDNCVQITQKLKKDLDIPIVWGGVHPTLRPEECLNYADIVCIGEAEETMAELARRIESGKDYRDIEGIYLKDKGEIVRNKIRALIQNLDSMPFQDYDYKTHYILRNKDVVKMTENLLEENTRKNYFTLATRGCPFGCSYCNNNVFNKIYAGQKIIRQRSVKNVIQELEEVKNKLPCMERIYFDDDAFMLYSLEEIKSFCSKYKELIKLPFCVTGITPITLNREKLSLLVDAGLSFIRMGIETGSERISKLYKRNYSNQRVINSAKIINEFKDKIGPPQYDIILDNPWEAEDDIIATLMLLTKLPRPYQLCLYSLTFYPQTELYEKAKKDGIITDDLTDVYRKFYHSYKNSYLNKLFHLLDMSRGNISTKMMALLTNKTLRKLNVGWLLYWILLLISLKNNTLLLTGWESIKKGDISKIFRWLQKNIADRKM
jgi:radical SAM superfamily enzyme YgiQ (UPF0313 family)